MCMCSLDRSFFSTPGKWSRLEYSGEMLLLIVLDRC